MNIKIKVINFLTNEVEIDAERKISSNWKTVENNHNVFRGAYPDCQVNFYVDDKNFIFSPPLNMEQDGIAYDEGRITWNDYVGKWYKGSPMGCNEDSDLDTIERYEEEDFLSRDAVCY